jgi:hypothetical protein
MPGAPSRWDPLAELSELRTRLDRMFDERPWFDRRDRTRMTPPSIRRRLPCRCAAACRRRTPGTSPRGAPSPPAPSRRSGRRSKP